MTQTGEQASQGKSSPAVELRGLTKAFGSLVANRNVSMTFAKGSIHAIVGENGAGKSTVMNMLYGMFAPDRGEILLDGVARQWRSPRDAAAHGIGMVHQHFMLAGRCSALDNIILGAEPVAKKWTWLPEAFRPIDREIARKRLEKIAADNHMDLPLDIAVDDLPVGLQQRLEILKLLYRDSRVLILDEPTAVLTPQEVVQLFKTLRRLRDDGRSLILITHKLKEVLSLADEITVMRRGEVVGHVRPQDTSESGLAELMVGRSVSLTVAPPPAPKLGALALSLQGVTLGANGGRPKLNDVSLAVARGEIVGIAGVEGNGQDELLSLIASPGRVFGKNGDSHSRLKAVGDISILGQDARRLTNAGVRGLGVGIVAGDRHRQAMVLGFDLAANFLLGRQNRAPYGRGGLIHWGAVQAGVRAAIAAYDVRPSDSRALGKSLSGGNQQKIVMARELEGEPGLLVCAQPTRGVDVGAIELIHKRILAARENGAGVLLLSSELSEIQALADRILVMYEGQIVAQYRRGEADEKTLGQHMGGARQAPRNPGPSGRKDQGGD